MFGSVILRNMFRKITELTLWKFRRLTDNSVNMDVFGSVILRNMFRQVCCRNFFVNERKFFLQCRSRDPTLIFGPLDICTVNHRRPVGLCLDSNEDRWTREHFANLDQMGIWSRKCVWRLFNFCIIACQCRTAIVNQWSAALLEQWRRLFEVVGHLQFYMFQKNKKAVIANAKIPA